jgi:hypothetical protein|tara:strand:+ start:6882 stop:7130 length:249 start_codon:yes stop_codon:yes gene_type:complete
MSRINIRLPQPPKDYEQSWAQRTISTLELQISEINSPASIDPYQTSNVTKDRVLDADSTTLAEVADVLGTLIEDLKGKGVIS